jgi:hypothetical protein
MRVKEIISDVKHLRVFNSNKIKLKILLPAKRRHKLGIATPDPKKLAPRPVQKQLPGAKRLPLQIRHLRLPPS